METRLNRATRRDRDIRISRAVFLALAFTASAECFAQKVELTDARSLTGKWVGSYACAQGLAGLTVTMKGNSAGQVAALFEFYPLPQNPRVSSGGYKMKGAYSMGALALAGSSWIEQPPGYHMVGLNGRVSADGKVFSGNVPECRKPFQLQKAPA